jgi:hypothetical protein
MSLVMGPRAKPLVINLGGEVIGDARDGGRWGPWSTCRAGLGRFTTRACRLRAPLGSSCGEPVV